MIFYHFFFILFAIIYYYIKGRSIGILNLDVNVFLLVFFGEGSRDI
jgi:hypothetical protein